MNKYVTYEESDLRKILNDISRTVKGVQSHEITLVSHDCESEHFKTLANDAYEKLNYIHKLLDHFKLEENSGSPNYAKQATPIEDEFERLKKLRKQDFY